VGLASLFFAVVGIGLFGYGVFVAAGDLSRLIMQRAPHCHLCFRTASSQSVYTWRGSRYTVWFCPACERQKPESMTASNLSIFNAALGSIVVFVACLVAVAGAGVLAYFIARA
jgi:hypothetical protein